MANLFNIYSTGHPHSRAVCKAIAEGTGFRTVPPFPLLEGGIATYGFLRGLLPTLRQAQAEGRPWVYADRGYFRATYGDDYRGYFRLTRDSWQHGGAGVGDDERWKKLRLEIKPWRKAGKHILVCPPGDVFTSAVGGFSALDWSARVLRDLKAATDRPIRVRLKAMASVTPLAADLEECHALVTYMSNTAVEAVLSGVPVFCTGECAASAMGKKNLAEIESPAYPENRVEWAQVLANNQWTLDEIRSGEANRIFS